MNTNTNFCLREHADLFHHVSTLMQPPKSITTTRKHNEEVTDLPLASDVKKKLEEEDELKLKCMIKAICNKMKNPQWETRISFQKLDFRDVKQREKTLQKLTKLLQMKGFEVTNDEEQGHQVNITVTVVDN